MVIKGSQTSQRISKNILWFAIHGGLIQALLYVTFSVCLSVCPSTHCTLYFSNHTSQGFPTWGWNQMKICSFLSGPRKILPTNFYSPLTKSQFTPHPPPPTKQQFSRYNPIKTAFLAVVIAPSNLAPFLF